MVNDGFTRDAARPVSDQLRQFPGDERVHVAARPDRSSHAAARMPIVSILGKCRSLKFS
jgi:hypothetical protein